MFQLERLENWMKWSKKAGDLHSKYLSNLKLIFNTLNNLNKESTYKLSDNWKSVVLLLFLLYKNYSNMQMLYNHFKNGSQIFKQSLNKSLEEGDVDEETRKLLNEIEKFYALGTTLENKAKHQLGVLEEFTHIFSELRIEEDSNAFLGKISSRLFGYHIKERRLRSFARTAITPNAHSLIDKHIQDIKRVHAHVIYEVYKEEKLIYQYSDKAHAVQKKMKHYLSVAKDFSMYDAGAQMEKTFRRIAPACAVIYTLCYVFLFMFPKFTSDNYLIWNEISNWARRISSYKSDVFV